MPTWKRNILGNEMTKTKSQNSLQKGDTWKEKNASASGFWFLKFGCESKNVSINQGAGEHRCDDHFNLSETSYSSRYQAHCRFACPWL